MTSYESQVDKILSFGYTDLTFIHDLHILISEDKVAQAKQALLNAYREDVKKARQFDDYGNPIIYLNRYEAEHVKALMDNLRQRNVQSYDTGDWWHDVPYKIGQWLEKLTTAGRGEKK